MRSFGKYNLLRVLRCCGMKVVCELCFLSKQLEEVIFIFLKVFDLVASNTTFHSCFGNGSTDNCNKTWVDRLWNKIFRTESKVVYMVNLIDNIGNRLFG